ncbi:MAG: Holliday junction branch migration protein RuvA [Stygiobacter sp.]|uniref:Holliday junction branch migration complex subunit RuvA n=1 Tax=Stygiobacter electus TaxID=3032292 RepID=A0AAE3P2L2_9BACT|nr:Holliday junction branch migration protein RuvA [Stygiobacter electus]MDF1612637.1 Holliday junction branch migration protein RuvA [Stygiobacter electus]
MIGFIKGKIIDKKPTKILIDVNGVGYLLNISINTFEIINDKEEISLYTYLHVREDQLELFGFYSLAEKEMFELLISVSGIGPKSAQSILSGIQIDDLKEALKTANISRLVSIPGIGRKTAERLMIELRDKVENISADVEKSSTVSSTIKNDAITALVNLGYNQKVSERIVRAILDLNPNCTIEDLIRESLNNLNK